MKKKINTKTAILLVGVAVYLLFFTSCATTKFTKFNTPQTVKEHGYHIYDDYFAFSNLDELKNQRFIFVRLYNPVYKQSFSTGSILQTGINLVEINKIAASHASIGFSLKDDFYGLTLYARPQFKVEHCTEPRKNEYMRQCKPFKSIQTVIGLKVTEKEYQAVLDMVTDFLINQNLTYDVTKNFQMAGYTIGRKMNSLATGQTEIFCPYIEGAQVASLHNTEEKSFDKLKKYKFVCSTLVSYILYQCVDSYRNYIDLNNLDWNNVGPSDLINFDGFKVMFTSTWVHYNRAAEEYLKSKKALVDFIDK